MLCLDVQTMLYIDQDPNFATMMSQVGQHCNNNVRMLCEHCGNVAPKVGTDIATTFRQCCVNAVATMISMMETDIETMFGHRCVNVEALRQH